jgi:hypothetical protein
MGQEYRQFQVVGPFKGIVDSTPAPNKMSSAFDDVVNMVCRKGRLQTRPRLSQITSPPDGNIWRNGLTFEDAVAFFHSVVLTTENAYYITAGPTYTPIAFPGGMTSLAGTGLPYGVSNIINRAYFSNGSVPLLYADGSDTLSVAGDVPGASRYQMCIANRLVLAHTTEPEPGQTGSTEFTFRVRWCVSGDPNDWTGFGSGFSDLLEVPDRITGLAALGRNGYIFRRNGISIMSPTGDGVNPFAIEQYSNAPNGVGSIFPYALAVFGNVSAFVAFNEIYSFNGVEITPIGGAAKKKIFADFADATGDEVLGFMCPNIGLGYDFLAYYLVIPGPNVVWVYHFDEQAWTRWTLPGDARATWIGNLAIE